MTLLRDLSRLLLLLSTLGGAVAGESSSNHTTNSAQYDTHRYYALGEQTTSTGEIASYGEVSSKSVSDDKNAEYYLALLESLRSQRKERYKRFYAAGGNAVGKRSLNSKVSTTVQYNADLPAATPVFTPSYPVFEEQTTVDAIIDQVHSNESIINTKLKIVWDAEILGLIDEDDTADTGSSENTTDATSSTDVYTPTPTSKVAVFNSSNAITDVLSIKTSLFTDTTTSVGCVGANGTAAYISLLFTLGGANTSVYLCPNVTITLDEEIYFSNANQTLATEGLPTDDTRAKLVVAGTNQSTAVYGQIGQDYLTLRSVVIDGQRDVLGHVVDGTALVEMAGTGTGHVIAWCKLYEPRGWSCLHAIEGTGNSCTNAIITNNEVGPSGNPPVGPQQLRKRGYGGYSRLKRDYDEFDIEKRANYSTTTETTDDLTTIGLWADGISVACKESAVISNTITDATDGAIVIFGAPNTTVFNNTIIANTRQLLGGINMVDYGPFYGNFSGVQVISNKIHSEGVMVKMGIAMGSMVWSDKNYTDPVNRTRDGIVGFNTFTSGTDGYFAYAIAVSGHDQSIISGNNVSLAKFGGRNSTSCRPAYLPPTPQALILDQYTTVGNFWQDSFYLPDLSLSLLICVGPNV